MNHEDRILEFALHRHFGDEEAVDVAARVAKAWERGASGALDEEELEEIRSYVEGPRLVEGRGRPDVVPRAVGERKTRRLPWILALALAAAVLCALGLRFLRSPADESPAPSHVVVPPFLVAEAEVLVLRGPARRQVRAREIERGDALLVLEKPVALAFGAGTTLHAQVPSLLVVDEKEGEPMIAATLGDFTLQTSGLRAHLRTDFAEVALSPSTSMSIELFRSDPAATPHLGLDVDLARTLLADFPEVRTLRLRVTSGDAAVSTRDVTRLLDASSGSLSIPSRRAPVVPETEFARYAKATELLFGLVDFPRWSTGLTPDLALALEDLRGLLERQPALRVEFRERLVEMRKSHDLPRMLTSILLDFLERDEDPEALALASDIWVEEPDRFQIDHVVGFAERGGFEFVRELEQVVDLYRSDPSGLEEPPVFPAAFLALCGDDAGRALLTEFAALPESSQVEPGWPDLRHVVAALALEGLGETDRWDRTVEFLATHARALLDVPDEKEALRVVLLLELMTERRAERTPPSLRGLVSAGYALEGMLQGSFDPDAIGARIDAVRAR